LWLRCGGRCWVNYDGKNCGPRTADRTSFQIAGLFGLRAEFQLTRLARFAWIVLAYTLAVIVWGAYVRASGSGAGCGSHWPLCNGDVVPRSPSIETLVEYSHRLTSGLALMSVVALLVWVRRACPSGHPARLGAALSVFFMLTEAGVGAGIVLFEYVADNESMARALFMGVHLMNTFLLIAAITLTAWWLSGGAALRIRELGGRVVVVAAGCVALLLVGSSGAIAALGDTLFPSSSLSDALWADLSATSHLLIRLRVLHPVIAVGAAVLMLGIAPGLGRAGGERGARAARMVAGLTLLQLGLGLLNVYLLAPIWLQLVHLLLADAIWIAFIVLSAEALRGEAVVPERLRRTSPVRA
jgi:heme A synthase